MLIADDSKKYWFGSLIDWFWYGPILHFRFRPKPKGSMTGVAPTFAGQTAKGCGTRPVHLWGVATRSIGKVN
jgi:hypothetical protein